MELLNGVYNFLVDEEEGAYKWNSLKPSTLLCLRDSFVDIVEH